MERVEKLYQTRGKKNNGIFRHALICWISSVFENSETIKRIREAEIFTDKIDRKS